MKVVIIGGGFCGTVVAKRLDKHEDLDITLFDSKDYFEYTPSIHKIMYEPGYYKKITVAFKKILKNTKIVTKPIISVTPKSVKTKSKNYEYDMLVISTGIDYPIFLENKKNVYILKTSEDAKKLSKALKKAKSVCLIGGGLIGTEVAGEIVTKSPKKKLTVIHSPERLLERNSMGASNYALDFLQKRGAEIIFRERVQSHDGNKFVTDKGTIVTADIGIWCAGIKADPKFMKDFPEQVFSRRRALEVNENLQLQGYWNIFVGGDINGIPEEKTAHNAEHHGAVIAKNILRLANHEKVTSYKHTIAPLVISLGDKHGIMAFKKFTLNGPLPGFLKHMIEYWIMFKTKHL